MIRTVGTKTAGYSMMVLCIDNSCLTSLPVADRQGVRSRLVPNTDQAPEKGCLPSKGKARRPSPGDYLSGEYRIGAP